MWLERNLVVKKVPKKIFIVQINFNTTFGLVKHSNPGFSFNLFTFTPNPMKNFILATCIAAGVTITPTAMAGPGEGAYSSAMMGRATTLTRALAHRIRFNEAQYLAVKQLHLQMLTERRDLEIMLNGASAEERDTQLAIAQQRYETELSQLLQPQQMVAYHNLRTSFTAHRVK